MSNAFIWLIDSDNGSLSLLLDTTVKATFLLVAAFLVLTLLPRISAAARHRMWCLTFAGLLLLPILSSLLPGWRVLILPRTSNTEGPVEATADDTILTEPGLPEREPVVEYAPATSSDDASEEFDPALSATETGENPGPSERAALPPVSNDEIVGSGLTTPIISLSTLPCLVWVLGACLAVLPVLVGPWRARRLTRDARRISDVKTLGLLRKLCRDLGIGRTVAILESDRPVVPMTWGITRPVVLLPSTWQRWSQERLQFVLLHELAHVKRYDVAFQTFARIACAAYWFHPLAWWALRRLRAERESACDDCVVTAGRRPSDYAKQLVEIARTHHFPATATAVAMARSSRLEGRVRAVLDQARSHLPLSRRAAWLFLVSTALVVTLLAIVRPGMRADGDGEPTASDSINKPTIESMRLDIYGDPLREGAVARLGTTRLRQVGRRKQIWILPDNKTLVSAAPGSKERGSEVQVWDAQTGEFKMGISFIFWRELSLCDLTPDGRTFVTLTRMLPEEGREVDNELRIHDTSTWKTKSVSYWVNTPSTMEECMAVTPEGKTVALVDSSGTIRFRDVASGDELPISTEKKYLAKSLAFSPDGKWLALVATQSTQSTPKGVFLWGWRSEEAPRRLPEDFVRPEAVCFSPDGKLLAVGSRDKPVQIWDVASLRKVRQLESAKLGYGAQNLVFSADGKLLAVPDNTAMYAKPPHGSKIDLFDVETGKLVQSVDTGGWGPGNVALSKNGELLAAVGTSDTIKAWRLPEGEPLGDRFVGHDQSPEEIQFTPDGKTIVTGAPDGTVRVWDAESGRQIEELKHDRPVNGLALSPDGRWILSSGLDDTVRLWDRESGKLLHKLKGHGFLGGDRKCAIGFTPDGKRIVSFGDDRILRIFSADGRVISEHDISLGREKRSAPPGPFSEEEALVGGMAIRRARLSADGAWLFLGTGGPIRIFDTESGRELDELDPEDTLDDFVVTPDRKRLVTVETRRYRLRKYARGVYRYKTFIRVRDLTTNGTLYHIETPFGSAEELALSPDGSQLAVSMVVPGPGRANQRWISVWDLWKGREIRRIEHLRNRPAALTFSPDGTRLASALNDSTVLVWDLDQFPVTSPLTLKKYPKPAPRHAGTQDEIDAALEKARKVGKRVLIIYANDLDKPSRDLLKLCENDLALARFKDNEFETVLVDALESKPYGPPMPTFGVDLREVGLPYLVILSADGKVVAKDRAFDSASGKCWDAERFYGFLKKWAVPKVDGKSDGKTVPAKSVNNDDDTPTADSMGGIFPPGQEDRQTDHRAPNVVRTV